ncbi:MAG: hydroxymethylglutaryl-CoA lyase [Thermomicrobiales bacterium]
MHVPGRVTIMEVGPRDGLQNESVLVPTEDKVALIRRLIATGLVEIEATAFVHPKWIPALADADDVMAALPRAGVRYSVLVPNMRGYERALPRRPDEIVLFCSATEGHNRANLNRSTAESLAHLALVAARAKADGFRLRGAISTSFWCPFEGRVPSARVCAIAQAYQAMGADEVGISDTLGAADPLHVSTLIADVGSAVDIALSLHLHDTYGMSLACAVAGLDAGITRFDSSIGGLGGCPYAPGAAGNIATEDLVFMLHRMGVETGINEDALLDAARYAESLVGHPLQSRRMTLAGMAEAVAH